MFHSCKNLKEINFCNFYTKNLIDKSYMFFGCECLQKIDLSNFDTKNVLDMSGLFYVLWLPKYKRNRFIII